jgi:hypothetical protein
MTAPIFPATAEQLERWSQRPEVLGVLLVGSKSRGHADAFSDDDLEVLLAEEAFAELAPESCGELHFEGEGPGRRLVWDAQYTALADLERKAGSAQDLDHWPYERAVVLLDRDGRVERAVRAAGRMDQEFRRLRLLHATVDAWIASARAAKTLRRGFEGAGRQLVARGAKALARLLFALEGRWVPLDHWLEKELATLEDPAQAGPALVEALVRGAPAPLEAALGRLEERLAAEGVPRPAERRTLFFRLVHPARAGERAVHGLS